MSHAFPASHREAGDVFSLLSCHTKLVNPSLPHASSAAYYPLFFPFWVHFSILGFFIYCFFLFLFLFFVHFSVGVLGDVTLLLLSCPFLSLFFFSVFVFSLFLYLFCLLYISFHFLVQFLLFSFLSLSFYSFVSLRFPLVFACRF